MEEINSAEDENAPKKGKFVRKALKITAIVLVICLCFLLLFIRGCVMAWGGFAVDEANGDACSVLKASSQQVEDCYKEKGESIPEDKEYYIYYQYKKDGYVNEPCELLPESLVNMYYNDRGSDRHRRYAVVKYKNGKACEVWNSNSKLTDNELHYYERRVQQEELDKHWLKGVRGIIGYYNTEEGSKNYH